MIRESLFCCALLIATSCSGRPSGSGGTPAPPPSTPSAPWSAARLSPSAVPQVYYTEWSRAENRQTCALLAPATSPDGVARRAEFSGGWGVAYDRPDLRSAFGVAGTGATPGGSTYQWPDRITYADGSTATWGLEGGTGPNHLAYITIPGQSCLYNVWSRLGAAHLQSLIASLRFVSS